MSDEFEDKRTAAVHAAICDDSPNECIEWGGKCVRAIEALTGTHAIVEMPKRVDGWWPGGNSEIHIDGSDIVQVTCGQSVYRSANMTRALAAGLLAATDASEVAR
ncbi:hypothetical protein RCF19_30005 [Rhodococcus qingshengii]